jgi:D-alanyl-D-alanine carboxypeptidase/D-alanyl-D-alanine-endopeptidase (penicillin-binding protein 4)
VQPGQQHRVGERLRQKIVGADVQRADLIAFRRAGGEHQHRRVDAGRTQPGAQVEPVERRQHQVQHDHVEPVRPGQVERLQPVADGPHRKAVLAQPVGQRVGERALVLDDQHARAGGHGSHGTSPPVFASG